MYYKGCMYYNSLLGACMHTVLCIMLHTAYCSTVSYLSCWILQQCVIFMLLDTAALCHIYAAGYCSTVSYLCCILHTAALCHIYAAYCILQHCVIFMLLDTAALCHIYAAYWILQHCVIFMLLDTAALCHIYAAGYCSTVSYLCCWILQHCVIFMLLDTADSLDVIGNTIVGVRPLPQSMAMHAFTAILICAHKQTDNHVTDS